MARAIPPATCKHVESFGSAREGPAQITGPQIREHPCNLDRLQ